MDFNLHKKIFSYFILKNWKNKPKKFNKKKEVFNIFYNCWLSDNYVNLFEISLGLRHQLTDLINYFDYDEDKTLEYILFWKRQGKGCYFYSSNWKKLENIEKKFAKILIGYKTIYYRTEEKDGTWEKERYLEEFGDYKRFYIETPILCQLQRYFLENESLSYRYFADQNLDAFWLDWTKYTWQNGWILDASLFWGTGEDDWVRAEDLDL
jgi:hypothetical protein